MPFIEAPTTFYLGRRYEPSSHRLADDVVYYDARDLTTHAIVVGMTGSGKTGLCITLLEEAILDNIPAIIVDPKGDITNLLLTFPDMRPEDFQPWVNIDDARRAGLDVPSYAADVAQRWRDGLTSWGIVPDRLRWLQQIARYSIYTPGSDAGLPVSILASLRAPREGWAGNEEANREKINGIVTALLALIGLSVEPVKDKEHVLISNIFEYAWMRGQDLTLEDVIIQVQRPPFEKLGVFPVDDYMSEKDRRKLAMDLNNIIAAPSFQSWIQGESLDIQNLLYMPNGQARVSIFYIAHLSEPERQFMITLLLENMLGWMRGLSGTTSLRSLLYIDEMFGYFPPYPKNPPTKEPILRLLKQARAFGLGMILATQNPGDLDYKGLSNAGTWFIGRLQSENDRVKVMSGLESLATADSSLDLKDVGRLIADVEPRVFLMNNVHDTGGPVMVHTRWAMSYLRGPLTRQQVQMLMAGQRQQLLTKLQAAPQRPPGAGGFAPPPTLPEIGGFSAQAAAVPPPTLPGDTAGFSTQPTTPVSQVTGSTQRNAPPGFTATQPPLPSSVAQYFMSPGLSAQQAISAWGQQMSYAVTNVGGTALAYRPMLLSQAAVRYQDRKANVYTARIFAYQIPDLERTGLIHWEQYAANPLEVRALTSEPSGGAIFGDLTSGFTDSKRLTALKGELTDMLYNTGHLIIPFNPTLKLYGNPDASESEFMAQAQQLAREGRDAELDKVAADYEKLMDKLEDQLKRKERELRGEKKELADRKREELFTKGEAVLSLLKGRTTYTLSRTSRTARMRRQTKEDLLESEEVISDLENEIAQLEQRFESEIQGVNDKWAKAAAEVQEYRITAYKKDIQVELFGIGWIPYYYAQINGQPLLLSAF
ncbi:MAG: DUF87 domain-containing protein [Anaerolineaceae bacterium]|nr:DUF87 domain-containing protein [Anaerolineaceae bacterium]